VVKRIKGKSRKMINFKEYLESMTSNGYRVPDVIDTKDLTDYMLDNIGSPDPDLRDRLVYSTFSHLIISKKIDCSLLRGVVSKVLDDNHLFYKIDQKDDLAVFTRTFSVLIVAAALYRHRDEVVFSEDEIFGIYKKVIRYAKEEMDLRGYVDEYGWAHSAAHTADALDELALCAEIDRGKVCTILDTVKAKIVEPLSVFICEEDERLAVVCVSILERGVLSLGEIVSWIKSFNKGIDKGNYMENYSAKLNIKNFMRSIYFHVFKNEEYKEITKAVLEVLEK